MSAAESRAKQILESENLKPHLGKQVMDDDDFDASISDDVETALRALRALRQIKENAQKDGQNKNEAQKDGQNKNEETISSVASDIKSSLDEFKSIVEEKRQTFDKALSESSKEYQSLLKTEVAKFQVVYKKFSEEKASYLGALKDVEERRKGLFVESEQLRKETEKALLSDYEKANAARIAQLEESLKKKKEGKRTRGIAQLEEILEEEETQDDETFSILRKNEETISSVASDIKSSLDELKSKLEKGRQSFAKDLSKISKECENLLKTKAAHFKKVCEQLSREKAECLQAVEDVISRYKEESKRLYVTYVELRKKELDMLSEHEKANAERIAQLEESMKKKKRDDEIFSTLMKMLGSSLLNASYRDFPPDD